MPPSVQTQTQYDQSPMWRSILELSAESEELLNIAMALGNFKQADEAVKEALHRYVDSQSAVELNPEAAASLHQMLTHSEEGRALSAQETRTRIHHWILQTASPRRQ